MLEVGQGLTARFAADWQALAPPGPVGLAVSGGPDSLALMVLMQKVAPRNFAVATVDHGLRPDAADEARMVADVCKASGIAHHTLTLDLAKGSAVQERARAARYRALADWACENGLAAIVTGHHADDQAETMAMRLNRGSGLRGLAGMRPVSSVPGATALPLLRPLLSWRRSELEGVVQKAGMTSAEDPSNLDPTYERVRIRGVMTSSNVLDSGGFAASARHLAEADAAIEWATDRLWAEVEATAQGFTWNAAPDLPRVLALRILERIVSAFEKPPPRGTDLANWQATLNSGGVSTLAGIKGDARRGPWRFTRAPDRRT